MENEVKEQGHAQAQASTDNLSIRDQLEAAYNEAQEPVKTEEGAAEQPTEPSVPEPAETAPTPTKKTAEEPAKETKGKAEAKPTEDAPPPEFLGGSKIDWNRLPAPIKKELRARYDDFQKQRQETEGLKQRYAEVDTALAPHLHRLATNYGSVGRALDQLAKYERAFSQNPAETIFYLAQQSGVDLAQLAAALPNAQPQQQPQQDAYAQRLATLENHLLAQERERQQQIMAQSRQVVERAQADERFPFFNDVRAMMSQLIRSGLANSIKDAYDQAVWSDPKLRQHLITAQREQIAQAKTDQAAKARKASSSLRGGTAAPGTDLSIPNNLSVRDALAQAADQLGF